MYKLNWNEKRPYPLGYRAGPAFKDYRVLKEIVLETFRIEWHDGESGEPFQLRFYLPPMGRDAC